MRTRKITVIVRNPYRGKIHSSFREQKHCIFLIVKLTAVTIRTGD
jgi:hypothetical protein